MRISPFEIMAARINEIFPRKNRISPDDKLLAALLYHLGLSYRRVSTAMEDAFSHESVRLWYRKIGKNLPHPDRIQRHLIAVDETKLKIAGRQVFIWSAIDVQRYEVLALKASATRGELDAILFVKEALQYCVGERPIILVDHGPWYPPALEHLGLRYKQVTFQDRNSVESWFHILKQKTKRFYNDFPFHSSMESVSNYLTSFVRMQNVLTARIT
jgi:transposase-like protein